jgi:hypothetical protein
VVHDSIEGSELLAQTSLDRRRLVVGALIELGPVKVANAGLLRRPSLLVVRVAPGAAYPAAAEASHQIGLWNLDVRGYVNATSRLGEGLIQHFRLGDVAWEAVEQDAGRGIGPGKALEKHLDGHRVRHELAAVHVSLGDQSEWGFIADGGPEEVAGGDMGQAQPLGQDLRLGALSCARGAQQDDHTADGNRHLMKPS